MRRYALVVMVAALGVALLAPSAPADPGAAAAKKCRKHAGKGKGKKKRCHKKKRGPLYVSLGDSLAVGDSASSKSRSFVGLLFAHYRSTLGVTQLSNRGVSGETSASQRGQQLAGGLADIRGRSDTRAVTIDIGANDMILGSCDFGADACTGTFKSNLGATLGDLQMALVADPGPEPLITVGYYNLFTGEGTMMESSLDSKLLGASVALNCADSGPEVGLNDAIAQVASAHGALFANVYPAFDAAGQSFISGDHLHPNDAGHQAIADAIIAAAAPC